MERRAPAAEDVRATVERILASEAFATSDRMSRLLRFVVERTLDGRGDEIKEYVLGTEVFDRGADYDPRLDSIVRVEARRLRTKLDEYYSGPGREDRVIVRIPRGAYVPEFAVRAPSPASATPGGVRHSMRARASFWLVIAAGATIAALLITQIVRAPTAARAGSELPRIAVLPFQHYPPTRSAESLADRVTDGVTSALARLGRLDVVSRTSTRQFASERRVLRHVAETLQADWIVEARVDDNGESVSVEARLVDAPRDRKVWVERFSAGPGDLDELAARIAAGVDAAARRR